MFSGFKRPGTNAGVGIVLKVGNDDELYVKSMQRAGPAFCSGVVKVGDLLLQVGGKDTLGKPVEKVKKMILGPEGSTCRFLFKRWACGGEESTIYSIDLIRRANIAHEAAKGETDLNSPPSTPGEPDALVPEETAQHSDLPMPVSPTSPSSPKTSPQGMGEDHATRGRQAQGDTRARSLSPFSLLKRLGKAAKSEKAEGGIGIVFKVGKDGGMYVKSMEQEGSARRSSLVQVGDCLMKIDGKRVFGKPVEKVVQRVLGPIGSMAEFQFQRWISNDADEPIVYSVVLTRGKTAEREAVSVVASPPNSAPIPKLKQGRGRQAPSQDPENLSEHPEDELSKRILFGRDRVATVPEKVDSAHKPLGEEGGGAFPSSFHAPGDVHDKRNVPFVLKDGPEVNADVAGEVSQVRGVVSNQAEDIAVLDSNSLPIEHVLRGRHADAPEEGIALPTDPSSISEKKNVQLRLTFARTMSELIQGAGEWEERNLDTFKMELCSEVADAIPAPAMRFRIDNVSETHARSCKVELTVLSHAGGGEQLIEDGMSSMQIAVEIQRQVADPFSLLRDSSWFSFVMNAVIVAGSFNTMKPASYGVPVPAFDMHENVSPGPRTYDSVVPRKDSYLHVGTRSGSTVAAMPMSLLSDAPGFPMSFGAPGLEDWVIPSLLAGDAVVKMSSENLRAQVEAEEKRDLNVAQGDSSLVASWLADSDSSLQMDTEIRRSVSMPELHQATGSRSTADSQIIRLRLRLSHKETQNAQLKQQNEELQSENCILRDQVRSQKQAGETSGRLAERVKALEAEQQKSSAECKVLKGLSASQAKVIEQYHTQNGVLAKQLRDQKRKERQEKKTNNNLSEVFSLELQLHAEKQRAAELEARIAELERTNAQLTEAPPLSVGLTETPQSDVLIDLECTHEHQEHKHSPMSPSYKMSNLVLHTGEKEDLSCFESRGPDLTAERSSPSWSSASSTASDAPVHIFSCVQDESEGEPLLAAERASEEEEEDEAADEVVSGEGYAPVAAGSRCITAKEASDKLQAENKELHEAVAILLSPRKEEPESSLAVPKFSKNVDLCVVPM